MRNLIIILIGSLATQTSAACTREVLQALTDAHLTAQTAGQTSFATNATYTENRKKVDIKSSILSKALKVDHARAQHDIPQCATFSEFIVTNPSTPYVIATQIHLDNTTNTIAHMDTIVTTKGDWLFNVTGTYYWATREKWDPIPLEKRDSRATIQSAADAYCNLFSDKKTVVPWGTPCARLEGGMYTGKGAPNDSCNVGVPSGVSLVNRRYVVDEEYGTVDIMMDFAGVEGNVGARGLPDSHEFRVEGGKLRYVHTLSSCGGKACM